jgi:DNA-binding transcriptional ArsR family regulator
MTEPNNLDTWLRILADEERRAAISYLREHREASLSELAEHVARTASNRPGEPSPPERDRTRTALYHVHLPLMDDADVVDWDHEERRIRVGRVPDATPAEIDA